MNNKTLMKTSRVWKQLCIVLLLTFLYSYSLAQKQKKVACIGNSITYGAGIKDRISNSYPAQLASMLGKEWDVRNFGVSARTLLSKGDYPYIVEKAYKNALKWNPDIVIIKLGTNDSKPHNWKYKNEFEKNYKDLIKSFRELPSKPTIHLCKAVPVFGTNFRITDKVVKNEVNPLIEKVAKSENLKIIDLYTALDGKKNLFPDGVHPNAKGAGIMAKVIYKNITGKAGKLVNYDFPGVKSDWKGHDRYDFYFNDRKAFIVVPKNKLNGKPWIWRARFPGWHTEMDELLLNDGFYVAYINTNNQFGSPKAMKVWNAFYNYLTSTHNFSKKVSLEGVSRGGLFVYNWAKQNPDKVNCIYTEAPVCDFKSWPGGFGKGKGSKSDWEQVKSEYGFKNDKEAKKYANNPIDNLEKLAKAEVPIITMLGLDDQVVPPTENSYIFFDRYTKLGGQMYVVPCTKGEHKLFGHHFPIETPKLGADFIKMNTILPKRMLDSKNYHDMRGGLSNSRMKFERTKKGRVAFLGGSITYNHGWRDMVCDYLKKRFPDTEFEFIAAGIPSMGSTPGAFRIDRDVLSKGKIDLLFEEASVNDSSNGRSSDEQKRAMEGIIRSVRSNNPAADVVFMYFVDPDKLKSYKKGETPEVIKNHNTIAAHYNIPSINLAKEVYDRIEAEEFTWEDDFKNLHPSPFGQKIYFNSMKTLLDNAWYGNVAEDDKITNHILPSPYDKYHYGNGKLIDIKNAKFKKGWEIVKNWKPTDGTHSRANYRNVPMLIGKTPGKKLKFEFTGEAVGIAIAAGYDAGILEYRIDGGEWKKQDLFTRWSSHLHLPWYYTLATGLKNKKHKLEIRLTEDKNINSKGTACRIRYFYVKQP